MLGKRPHTQIMKPLDDQSISRAVRETRRIYQSGELYPTGTICALPERNAPDYATRLLADKLDMVERHRRPGVLVDLCCATGRHLVAATQAASADRPIGLALGIDFSEPYVVEAANQAPRVGAEAFVRYVCADAAALPLSAESVDTVFCLSSLYAIPGVQRVVGEIGRILRPGGTCVLDFGNRRSLNALAIKYGYPELPIHSMLTLQEIDTFCAAAGLQCIERRAYQILPLWAKKPWWMRPILADIWTGLARQRFQEKLVDQWLSELPFFRPFAFRHVMAFRKHSQ